MCYNVFALTEVLRISSSIFLCAFSSSVFSTTYLPNFNFLYIVDNRWGVVDGVVDLLGKSGLKSLLIGRNSLGNFGLVSGSHSNVKKSK